MPQVMTDLDGNKHTFPDDAKPEEMIAALKNYKAPPKPKIEERSWPNAIRDNAIDLARPFISGMAAATAGPETTGPLSIVAAPAAYSAMDAILQHLKSQPERGMIANMRDAKPGGVEATLENTAEQWGLGKVIGKGVQDFQSAKTAIQSELGNPGSVTGSISKILPSFSTYVGPDTKLGKVANYIESTFARGSKVKSQQRSAQVGFDKFMSDVGLEDNPNLYANRIAQEGMRDQFNKIEKSIGANNGIQKLVGRLNPKPILSGIDADGVRSYYNVAGPVDLGNSQGVASKYLQSMRGMQLTEPDQKVMDVIRRIDGATSPLEFEDPASPKIVRGPNGRFQKVPGITSTGPRPVSFEDVNDARDIIRDMNADPNFKNTILSNGYKARDFFSNLLSSIDKDIEGSMSKWGQAGDKAQQAFKNQQFLETARKDLMQNKDFATIIDNPDLKPNSAINSIIDNAKQLAQVIKTGKLEIPDIQGNMKIKSSNIRADLQRYEMLRLMDGQVTRDAAGKVTGVNAQAIRDALNSGAKADSYKELFSPEQMKRMNTFWSAMASTQTPVAKNFMTKVFNTAGGVGVAGHLFGISPLFSDSIAAVRLGGGALGYLMNDEKAARIMAAAVKGAP